MSHISCVVNSHQTAMLAILCLRAGAGIYLTMWRRDTSRRPKVLIQTAVSDAIVSFSTRDVLTPGPPHRAIPAPAIRPCCPHSCPTSAVVPESRSSTDDTLLALP